MTSFLRQDSDRETGMADDFSKTLSKTAGVLQALFETRTSPRFPLFLPEHVDIVRVSWGMGRGYNYLQSIFKPRALRYCVMMWYTVALHAFHQHLILILLSYLEHFISDIRRSRVTIGSSLHY